MPFQKGNPGGPGRPPKVVEDAQQSVLLDLFNEAEERAVVKNMIALAKRRGALNASSAISAATWLWDRKYGKVKDQIELSGGVSVKGYASVNPDDWDEQSADPAD